MPETPDITIIGAGKVGTALGVLARRCGWRVSAVADVDGGAAGAAAEAIGPDVQVCPVIEAAGAGQLVLLTTPDDAIAPLCAQLAGANAFADGAVVAHCSGALASDILAPARDRCGCDVGSMHPLQTFPSVRAAVDTLGGAFFFCEGDEKAVAQLQRLAESIGGKAVRIDPSAKALYHAAGVFACNYLIAILDAAVTLYEQAGIDRATALEALGPLVRATVGNALAAGPAEALTGPIARGDVETVQRHLDAMAEAPTALRELYRAAGAWTARLARSKGTPCDAIEDIRKLLADKDT